MDFHALCTLTRRGRVAIKLSVAALIQNNQSQQQRHSRQRWASRRGRPPRHANRVARRSGTEAAVFAPPAEPCTAPSLRSPSQDWALPSRDKA